MNKETLEEANWKVLGTKNDTFYNGAKWQQERMYSEEDVKQMLIDCCGEVSCEDGVLVGKTPVELYKWIDEQFKKK